MLVNFQIMLLSLAILQNNKLLSISTLYVNVWTDVMDIFKYRKLVIVNVLRLELISLLD